ncbi:MAG: LysE family transporter [Oceanihabitans sp.]
MGLAVFPPGLLNITAAKVSLKEGHTRGIMFSIGACIIVLLQNYIAISFAKYLSNHPDVIGILKLVAIILFLLISIYFILIAKSKEKPEKQLKVKSKKSRFFQGIFLSSINVFPIPFQSYMTITLASLGWLQFDKISSYSYVAGAGTGAFIILYIYIFFFDKIKDKPFTSQKNMNYLIGGITGIVALISLIDLIKNL